MKAVGHVVALAAVLITGSVFGPVLLGGCSKATPPPEEKRAGDGIAWVYDLEKGLEMAAGEGKPVMVDVYADWCTWCKTLDEETYSDARVQDSASRFVAVKLDADQDEASCRKYDVQGLPTILFLTAEGEEIDRVIGFAPPDTFLKAMDRALSKAKQN